MTIGEEDDSTGELHYYYIHVFAGTRGSTLDKHGNDNSGRKYEKIAMIGDKTQMDFANYRLNQPKGPFSEKGILVKTLTCTVLLQIKLT